MAFSLSLFQFFFIFYDLGNHRHHDANWQKSEPKWPILKFKYGRTVEPINSYKFQEKSTHTRTNIKLDYKNENRSIFGNKSKSQFSRSIAATANDSENNSSKHLGNGFTSSSKPFVCLFFFCFISYFFAIRLMFTLFNGMRHKNRQKPIDGTNEANVQNAIFLVLFLCFGHFCCLVT